MGEPQLVLIMPVGWLTGGGQGYARGLDRAVYHTGKASGFIKAVSPEPQGPPIIVQTFSGDDYRGKRLRMSAYVKGENLDMGASLFMLVGIGPSVGLARNLAYDNMMDRKIKGTSDWKKYEIVLDVPENNALISFGFGMSGKGQVWVYDFQFEVVGQDVPTTKPTRKPSAKEEAEAKKSWVPPVYRTKPVNLDFEQ